MNTIMNLIFSKKLSFISLYFFEKVQVFAHSKSKNNQFEME